MGMQIDSREWGHLVLREVATRAGGEDLFEFEGHDPSFIWRHGSTLIEAWSGERGEVRLRAFLLFGAELSLFEERRMRPRLGTLESEGGDIALLHSVPGVQERTHLAGEVSSFCHEADRLDDALRQRLGGQRAHDRLSAMIQAAFANDAALLDQLERELG